MNDDVLQIKNALLEQQIYNMQKQMLIMQNQINYLNDKIDELEHTYIISE